jgi:geranylgeranyl diphosphate synthase, type II
VAKKHGDVMRAMPSLKKFADKIQHITNGVRKEDWQASDLSNPDGDFESLLKAKETHKKNLLDWAWRHCRLWPTWAKENAGKNIVVVTRRITPYKRLDVLSKLLMDPAMKKRFLNLNLLIFVGGRIHQQDNHAQDMVYDLLDIVEKDEALKNLIVFVDNFNIWEAPLLYRGATGSIMMADDTREASATGFMKAQMNGAAVIATSDGAVPEFVKFSPAADFNGFFIPYVNGEPTAIGLLEALEGFAESTITPEGQVDLMRKAIRTTGQIDIARTVKETKTLYEQVLKPGVIHKAMRYSVFAGGKRLRPILVIAAAEACGGRAQHVMPTACAMELIHTYSLVHDDLPAMDDDDLRRGIPTNHKVFGEDIAILAGDGLLTEAFRLIGENSKLKSVKPTAVAGALAAVAKGAGTFGMIGGQVADIKADKGRWKKLNKKSAQKLLDFIHLNKTAALIIASLQAGARLVNATPAQLNALESYGKNMGLAFQVQDDILDRIGDKKKLGKKGSDVQNQKLTYPALIGLDKSKNLNSMLGENAHRSLKIFGKKAAILHDIADFLTHRDH